MSTNNYGRLQPGQVGSWREEDPPISSLAEAFDGQEANAQDAIVLRGYLGRSNILSRSLDYLERAQRERVSEVVNEIRARGLPTYRAEELVSILVDTAPNVVTRAATLIQQHIAMTQSQAEGLLRRNSAMTEVRALNGFIHQVRSARDNAQVTRQIPWRLYLTPRLDTYVDFHRSSLLAYRREAKADRQDACTIWLRMFQDDGRMPIPYRVVHEATIGPSFATWIGGEMVDDYAADGSSGSAWGDQAGVYGGFRTGTGKSCLG